MSGQAANETVSEVKSCIKYIETNYQMSKGSGEKVEKKSGKK